MDRRQLLKAGLASPLIFALPASASDPTFIADMHAHLYFAGTKTAAANPLAKNMAGGRATLVAWSLVGDLLWMHPTPGGYRQKSEPAPGEPVAWFKRELARIKAHLAEQNLKIVRTPQDVELALTGDPHVVLSVEGASFVENDLGRLQEACDLGIRHIQLVHYVRNTLGDFQTERPEHKGLTDLGNNVVRECNRLGILVDLAHSSSDAVAQALAISKAPMVWSHSSVTNKRTPNSSMVAWQARQLGIAQAKAIASKGGVVGLWTLTTDVGATVEHYGDRLLELSGWLGDDHVAFGTDMNGLPSAAISSYADLRRVVDYWQRKSVSQARIRKLAIENYARVLRQALQARET